MLREANENFIQSRMQLLSASKELCSALKEVLAGLPVDVDWARCDCFCFTVDAIGIYSREATPANPYHELERELRSILNPWVVVYGSFSEEVAKEIINRVREALMCANRLQSDV